MFACFIFAGWPSGEKFLTTTISQSTVVSVGLLFPSVFSSHKLFFMKHSSAESFWFQVSNQYVRTFFLFMLVEKAAKVILKAQIGRLFSCVLTSWRMNVCPCNSTMCCWLIVLHCVEALKQLWLLQATPRFYLAPMEKNQGKAWDHYYSCTSQTGNDGLS